jgi:hypothetical protein
VSSSFDFRVQRVSGAARGFIENKQQIHKMFL